ncbi:hypothetical protein G6F50_017641 [Rhizopus delemar]|uniref:Uncharacterized protein n=1 Tax=Rhizopus delemar TaxID=936053 RepID=A0A9P6XPG9_9FUNG|nr:hypothetical protein G6F50_017641 [Rhizopus delemar]
MVLHAAQHVVMRVEVKRADDDRHVQQVFHHRPHARGLRRIQQGMVEEVVAVLDPRHAVGVVGKDGLQHALVDLLQVPAAGAVRTPR